MNKMTFYTLTTFSSAMFLLCVAEELTLPIKTCQRNSTDYTDCLRDVLTEGWPRFANGLPEFDVPSLDPLYFEHGTVVFDRNEVHGEVNGSNVIVYGFAKTEFLAVRPHFLDDIFRLEVDVRMPRLIINGDINAKGSLGGFRMGGQGYFNATTDDVRTTWDIIGHIANDRWVVDHFMIIPSIGKLKVYFRNIFGDSKELNDLAIIFVNEYWPLLYRISLPQLTEIWDPWATDLCNRLFSKIPFSQLFP